MVFNFETMNIALFITAILTAGVMVAAALVIAALVAPSSFNRQKGEPYECGIPTRGTSWLQFRPGYYLLAILFLMFDVEAVFLFPWAVIVRSLGIVGFINVLFFLFILIAGLAYAWKKGALEWSKH
jgi:NADH-quinone oxidoreductase subunit A